MELLDGKRASRAILELLQLKVAQLTTEGKKVPHLTAVLVGNNGASETYVGAKVKACAEIGYKSTLLRLDASVSENRLLNLIHELNNDADVDGILVQLPLPAHISDEKVINAIHPSKDVDGFHPVNVGKLMLGNAGGFLPCTPAGVWELLIRSQVQIEGAEAVILGRGNIVGKPMAAMLCQKAKNANATVTICHSQTRDIKAHCRRADILIAAMGSAKFVTADMVKPGAVVIDVGVNRIPDPGAKGGSRLVGDVDFDAVQPIAGKITPNPGGVGPMTIAMLMQNTVRAAELAS